jgi:hypothetical protein
MPRKRTPYRSSTASIGTSALIRLKLTHVVGMDALSHDVERNWEVNCSSYGLVSLIQT